MKQVETGHLGFTGMFVWVKDASADLSDLLGYIQTLTTSDLASPCLSFIAIFQGRLWWITHKNECNKRHRAFCPPLLGATRSKLTSDKTAVLRWFERSRTEWWKRIGGRPWLWNCCKYYMTLLKNQQGKVFWIKGGQTPRWGQGTSRPCQTWS